MCKTGICALINHRMAARLAEAGLPPELLDRVAVDGYHFGGGSYPYLCSFRCDDREVHRVYGEEDLDEFMASDVLMEGLVRTILRITGNLEEV